jgi:hypothetical protein
MTVRTNTVIEIEGKKVLFLPHIYAEDSKSLKLYEEKYGKETKNTDLVYDIVVGHITDSRLSFPSIDKVDISSLQAKKMVFGHIHNGEYDNYVGSMVANSISENDFPRYILGINNDWTEKKYPIPTFLEYKEVTYPETLPKTIGQTIVYTILNCQDENIARTYYNIPDMFIRKCTYTPDIDKESFHNTLQSLEDKKDVKYFIKDWLESKNNTISEGIKKKIDYYAAMN